MIDKGKVIGKRFKLWEKTSSHPTLRFTGGILNGDKTDSIDIVFIRPFYIESLVHFTLIDFEILEKESLPKKGKYFTIAENHTGSLYKIFTEEGLDLIIGARGIFLEEFEK